jgi:hypothetical protein
MALTPEQQAEVDKQAAIAAAQVNANAAEAAKARKLQCLNIAQTVLLENKRNLPVDQRQITTDEITAFAAALETHINA